MATTTKTEKDTTSNAEALAVPSLLSILEEEEVVGAEASFVLTPELRSAIERGAKKTAENPGGWLRITIPADVHRADGSVWSPSDSECKTILSDRETELRAAALQLGFSFRRQTPKKNGQEEFPRVMLYRINKRNDSKVAEAPAKSD